MFDVITIGTATQDVYVVGKSLRPMKDPHFTNKAGFFSGKAQCLALGGKLEVENIYITTGGGATNAAVTFARQGFKTATVAKVGDDIAGVAIEDELIREGIVPYLSRDKKKRTAYSTILLSPNGERTILVYRGASEDLKATDIPWAKMRSRWAYFASGGINLTLLKRLVDFFHHRGTLIAINPGKAQLSLGLRRLAPVIAKTKVFIVNREEAGRLAGKSPVNKKNIFRTLDKAIGGILVVTDAERGSMVSDGHRVWHAGTFKERKIVDRTGAGDSFGSGFVAGLMQKGERCERGVCRPANIAYALRLASANATANIESIGAKSGILTRSAFREKRWTKFRVWYNTSE